MTDKSVPDLGWSYEGDSGPDHWSSLSESFKRCDEGLQQSPVDIAAFESVVGERITFLYDSNAIAVNNTGRTISVWYEMGSSMAMGGRVYDLVTAHHHAPSEHLIDGVRFAAEIHLVHESAQGELAVVARLFEFGDSSTLVENLLEGAVTSPILTEDHRPLHSSLLQPSGEEYYHYVGSTTTPPCIEPVEWMVIAETTTISVAQFRALLTATGGPNNRPVQALNGRTITHVV